MLYSGILPKDFTISYEFLFLKKFENIFSSIWISEITLLTKRHFLLMIIIK